MYICIIYLSWGFCVGPLLTGGCSYWSFGGGFLGVVGSSSIGSKNFWWFLKMVICLVCLKFFLNIVLLFKDF